MNLESYIRDAEYKQAELERQIAVFDFNAKSQAEFTELNHGYQKFKRLREAWDEYQKAENELHDSMDLLKSCGNNEQELKEECKKDIFKQECKMHWLDGEIKRLILPEHPNEGKKVILEIRPAAGGDEAAIFVGDLLRMYQRFFDIQHWHYDVLELSDTSLSGVKSVSMSITGSNAWSLLRFESGVHRVQRVPVTETQGRIHTSTATVAVVAEATPVDFELKPEDLRIDVFRSSGHGGQCVNTTDSAVRVTHIPTGMFVASQQEKSQHRNKEIAMTILRSRLLEIKQREEDEKNASERKSQVGTGDRSERIRTYNFPQNRVTDHRFDVTLYDLTNVMEGNLLTLLSEIRDRDANNRFNAMLGN